MPAAPKPERAPAKRAKPVGRLYWSISEVAKLTGVKAHVLRYWETEFPTLKPRKGNSGKRTYRERDVELVIAIKHLLYDKKYTIKGARQRLAETRKVRDLLDQLEIPFPRANQRQLIQEIREELEDLRDRLAALEASEA
ncbi:MAG: MerR family transcriptional regulator [Candidatus Krumholzibacteriota bacterium]|nr:MerR family transcriptional regulator [Candidatus Krumholzibacteriota bacterium]